MEELGGKFWLWVVGVALAVGILISPALASALAPARHDAKARHSAKASRPARVAKTVGAPRPHPGAAFSAPGTAAPSTGKAPSVIAGRAGSQVRGTGNRSAPHKAAPALLPSHGTVLRSAPTFNAQGKAAVRDVVRAGPAHPGAGRLLIPPPSATHPQHPSGFFPSSFYSSTQLDNFSLHCGFGVNETTIAQSTTNPNLVVAGANTYYDNNGNCQDSHVGVYYSSDGGRHWKFEVMPGLIDPFS